MSQLAEVPSQVRIKKPLKDKFRTTHDIHWPAVKMGKCQKLTYLQMASSDPVPCRGIIQTVVFVGIYWTEYGGCTQPAWPPFGVTNTNTIFNKYTCGSFTNMNTVYHNIHLHCTHWSSWRTVLPFLSITNEYVENGYPLAAHNVHSPVKPQHHHYSNIKLLDVLALGANKRKMTWRVSIRPPDLKWINHKEVDFRR